MNQHVPFPLDPNLQRLVREPLSEPPPLAREHWKTLTKAMERLDQARVQQTTYGAETARLREELGLARQRDQQALGRALAAGEHEPESEAAGIEAEIERNTRREAAMTDVILEAQRAVAELILRNKDGWAKDLARHIADTAAAYRTAIVEMERARESLVAEVQLGGWLAVFPGTGGQPPDLPAAWRSRRASRRPRLQHRAGRAAARLGAAPAVWPDSADAGVSAHARAEATRARPGRRRRDCPPASDRGRHASRLASVGLDPA